MPKYGTDYTKSAIDLKNPLEVRDLLLAYGKAEEARDVATDILDAIMDKLPEHLDLVKASKAMEVAYKAVKEAIDRCGSLQDIAEGLYALKQGRQSVTLNPVMVRELLPQFAPALIKEAVDATRLAGLVKGNLVNAVQLARIEIRTELAPAYIIGLVQKPEEE